MSARNRDGKVGRTIRGTALLTFAAPGPPGIGALSRADRCGGFLRGLVSAPLSRGSAAPESAALFGYFLGTKSNDHRLLSGAWGVLGWVRDKGSAGEATNPPGLAFGQSTPLCTRGASDGNG